MEAITGVPVTTNKFKSPFRKDNDPSCAYYYNDKGNICMNDFAGYVKGDIFKVMAYRMGLLSNNKILQKDLFKVKKGLWEIMQDKQPWSQEKTLSKDVSQFHSTSIWKWKRRNWDVSDKKYWSSYGIKFYEASNGKLFCPLLEEYEVIPISHIWINDLLKVNLTSTEKNPSYLYKIKNLDNEGYSYKCYKPLSLSNNKWRSTTAKYNPIQGWEQLQNHYGNVVICTSLKDAIVWHLLFPEDRAIAWPSESCIPVELPITPYLYVSDSDWAGMRTAVQFKNKFNLSIFHLPMNMKHELGVKDISDLVKLWGISKTKNYVSDRKQQLINGKH